MNLLLGSCLSREQGGFIPAGQDGFRSLLATVFYPHTTAPATTPLETLLSVFFAHRILLCLILWLSSDPRMSAQQPRCLHCLSGHISLRKHFIFFSMSEKHRAIPELYCSPGHQRALPMLPSLCPQQCIAPYPPDSSFSCPVFTSRVKHSLQSSPSFHFCFSYVHILICVL